MSRPLCIYHAKCIDGLAAAWAVSKFFDGEVDLSPCSYGQIPPKVTGRTVIIVDFSFPRETLLDLSRTAHRVLVLDHHKTAALDLQPRDGEIVELPVQTWQEFLIQSEALISSGESLPVFTVFDMERSGCGIAWDFFFPTVDRPPAIVYAEDHDLWRFRYAETKAFHAYLSSFPKTLEDFQSAIDADVRDIRLIGSHLLRFSSSLTQDIALSTRRLVQFQGITVPIANVPGVFASDAGHLLSEGYSFSLTYYDGAGFRNFSLRSPPEGADVSEIAKQFGGGGHKHAAGFRLSFDQCRALGIL